MRVTLTIFAAIAAGITAAGAYVAVPASKPPPTVVAEPPAARVIFPSSNAIGKADRLARDLSLPFARPVSLAPLGDNIAAAVADAARSVLLAPPQMATEAGSRAEPRRAPEKPTSILLNEAQISSIRERLKLSSEQARLWPEAESALRQLVTRLYRAQKSRSVSAPDDAEIARLKARAAPFLASLTNNQRGDIRLLAGVAGLDPAMLGI